MVWTSKDAWSIVVMLVAVMVVVVVMVVMAAAARVRVWRGVGWCSDSSSTPDGGMAQGET